MWRIQDDAGRHDRPFLCSAICSLIINRQFDMALCTKSHLGRSPSGSVSRWSRLTCAIHIPCCGGAYLLLPDYLYWCDAFDGAVSYLLGRFFTCARP